jgi:hypothetical protein
MEDKQKVNRDAQVGLFEQRVRLATPSIIVVGQMPSVAQVLEYRARVNKKRE